MENEPAPDGNDRTGRLSAVTVTVGALPSTGKVLFKGDGGGLRVGGMCIVKTSRGMEMGVLKSEPELFEGNRSELPGEFMRPASLSDLQRQKKIEDAFQPEEGRYCRQKIDERGLRMKLSAVEHLFGGERIVFYFTAEKRVDFRALVRDLAWKFHTRIELRQVGARDEARLLANYEHCGRELCCKTFLRVLEPVTMRMAKHQRTTLDPQKISGRCGRLMCCLRFEEEVYTELRRSLPADGTRVTVGRREGEVVSGEVMVQMVTVRFGDGSQVKVGVGELRPPKSGSARTSGGGRKEEGHESA